MHDSLRRASVCFFFLIGCADPRVEAPAVDASMGDAASPLDAGSDFDAAVVEADAGPRPAVSPREFGAARAEAICAQLFACCDAAQVELVLRQEVRDEAMCAALLSSAYATWVGQVESAVARGTLDYDADRATACITAIDALTCETLDVRVAPDACRRVALGLVSDGDPCTMEDECADASSCRDGVCVAPVAEGADCSVAPCAIGFYCGGMGAGPRCLERIPDGSACVIDSQCASQYCEGDAICARSRACEPR
jgi:hypothetical protein